MRFCLKIKEPPLKPKYKIKTDSEISTVRERWRRTIAWSATELEIKYLISIEVYKKETTMYLLYNGSAS